MVILLVLALGVAAFAVTRRGGPDLPERLVAFWARRLPDRRSAWGQALIAELAVVSSPSQRWRFAAGAMRLALFPPLPHPNRARTACGIGAVATLAATAAVVWLLPTLSVFVAALGLLTTGVATVLAGRRSPSPVPRRLAPGAVAVMGVLAVTGALVVVAIAHPSATQDPTHVFSLVLATTLTGYLLAGLSLTGSATTTTAARWGGVLGAGAAVVASILAPPAPAVAGLISPAIAAATLLAAVCVGAVTKDRSSAVRSGVLVAILSAPVTFTVAIIRLQDSSPTALDNPYDIDAYARSGYPDVASYLISDALGGNIVLLAVTPLAMYVLASLAAAGVQRVLTRATRQAEVHRKV